jgi:hypothetical protein
MCGNPSLIFNVPDAVFGRGIPGINRIKEGRASMHAAEAECKAPR